MSQLIIQIELGNSAIVDDGKAELCEILRRMIVCLPDELESGCEVYLCLDSNGNQVLRAKIVEDATQWLIR